MGDVNLEIKLQNLEEKVDALDIDPEEIAGLYTEINRIDYDLSQAENNGFISYNLLRDDITERTYAGVNVTRNGDGGFKLVGTATGGVWFFANESLDLKLKKGTYALTSGFQLYNGDYFDGIFTLNEDATMINLVYNFPPGTSLDTVLYCQLVKGTEEMPYTRYSKSNVKLTEEIKQLTDLIVYKDFIYSDLTIGEKTNYNQNIHSQVPSGYIPISAYIYGESLAFIASVQLFSANWYINIYNMYPQRTFNGRIRVFFVKES